MSEIAKYLTIQTNFNPYFDLKKSSEICDMPYDFWEVSKENT
jgi:hypothetical protein